jgi:hypothetical protein
VLAPTLALALTWLVAVVVLLGCGYLCRQALVAASGYGADRQIRPTDLWIGLAALVAYLEVWSLFKPVNSKALIAPCVAAAFSVAFVRRPAVHRLARRATAKVIAIGAASALGVLWLANQSLGRPTSYDSGLYHFAAVEYAGRFAAIPGVGNLHERLGAADSHLLLVALLGSGPWRSAGFHLANGLLAVMLLADVGWRLAEQLTPPFTRRAMVLLVPATLAVLTIDPGVRLRSPSLDLPAFILVAAGTMYLCEVVEQFDVGAAIAATAAFATASATRPLFLPATIVTAFTVAAASRRSPRVLAVVVVIPAAVVAGWAIRQAVLSGYPLFPLTFGALPVDWRVRGEVVGNANDWIRAWARAPHKSPDVVLASWAWLPGWLVRTFINPDFFFPFALVPFAAIRVFGSRPSQRLLFATLAPLLLTLALWLIAAPDPRFVLAPLWLVPILLLACRPHDGRLAIVCLVLVGTAIFVGGAWRPITQRGNGPLGSFDPPTPRLHAYRTHSGLIIYRPVDDARCWRRLLCTPSPNMRLLLRRHEIADGFRTARPKAAATRRLLRISRLGLPRLSTPGSAATGSAPARETSLPAIPTAASWRLGGRSAPSPTSADQLPGRALTARGGRSVVSADRRTTGNPSRCRQCRSRWPHEPERTPRPSRAPDA